MASKDKRTVGRYVRLTADADNKLSELKRWLSASQKRDLTVGDVIEMGLDSLRRQEIAAISAPTPSGAPVGTGGEG